MQELVPTEVAPSLANALLRNGPVAQEEDATTITSSPPIN
jgi:hypothetical protein